MPPTKKTRISSGAPSDGAAAGKTPMTRAHKAALALGREQSKAVRRYLEALEANRPKRGRKRTKETVTRQLAGVEAKLAANEASPLTKLHLVQEKKSLQAELAAMAGHDSLATFEKEFVAAAREYGMRKRIDYGTWREMGVPAEVLRKAGITRSQRA